MKMKNSITASQQLRSNKAHEANHQTQGAATTLGFERTYCYTGRSFAASVELSIVPLFDNIVDIPGTF